MNVIAAVKLAETPAVSGSNQAENTKETKKTTEINVASALSGATNPKDKKTETEQELRTQFKKKAKEQKSSILRYFIGLGISSFAGIEGFKVGFGLIGGHLGANLAVGLLGGIALGGILAYGMWNLFKPSDKYKNTVNDENKRRADNMIDAKVKQGNGKGIDKSIVDTVPVFNDSFVDPVYQEVAIYNDKNGNPEIVGLNKTSKEFNQLLEGYSTDEQPDLKADGVSDFAYKAKAIFLKADTDGSKKAQMNAAFDEMIAKFTAATSAGGKDLTKDELVQIRHDLRSALAN